MKRLLAFLLLVALGITALHFAVGDDETVRANSEPSATSTTTTPRPRPPAGVTTQQGRIPVSVSQNGPIELPQFRSIRLPDGSTRNEKVFHLSAADSAPISEAVQQLDDVEVLLFEHDTPTVRLIARQAFLELDRDASGKPSLREHKDIDLRDAVIHTLPGSSHPGMRLELGNAKVKVGDDELVVTTANETDPVNLVVAGERSGTLRGKGLQARFPRDRKSPLQRIDVEVLHEPDLVTDGARVTAKGRLHWSEDLADGAGRVTLDDDVRLVITSGGAGLGGGAKGGGDAEPIEIRGDQFVGRLLRAERDDPARGGGRLAWRQLLFTGAPAVVTMGRDKLRTPKIKVLPGPLGDACQITAYGGESTVEIDRFGANTKIDGVLRGTSPRRIHVLDIGNSVGATHRQFGFPQWTLRPLTKTHCVAFEGDSRIEDASRTITSSKGLQVLSRTDSRFGAARGSGAVRIERRPTTENPRGMLVTGNDGFAALLSPEGERWRLGPPAPAVAAERSQWRSSHHYEVVQGNAKAHGTGACEVIRRGTRTNVVLRAPGPTISARLGTQGVDLDGLNALDVVLEDTEVASLDAAGLPARATRSRDGDVVTATAPRFEQIGPGSLRLTTADQNDPERRWFDLAREHARPVLSRQIAATGDHPAMEVVVEGPRIDAHHLGGSDVFVDAVAVEDWRPVVTATWADPAGTASTSTFEADRLRALPFAMTREAQRMFAAGATGPVAGLPFHALGKAWLIADGVHRFHLEDPRQGVFDGVGKRLVLSQGAEAALFLGDPDDLVPAEVRRTHEGREAIARGAQVRVFRDDSVRLQALRAFPDRSTFVLPTVTLHDPRSPGLLAHMTSSCQGDIEVMPDAVVFHGPVKAHTLRPDGEADDEGMQIGAEQLRMVRRKDTGEVVQVLGKGVDLDWSQAKAHSAEVELDLRWGRLIARDPDGAVVTLPDDRRFVAPRIELNYETMTVTTYRGRLEQVIRNEAIAR